MKRLSTNPALGVAKFLAGVLTLAPLVLLGACSGSDGSTGPAGPAGPPVGTGPTASVLSKGDTLPGVAVAITGLTGGTAANGGFQAGDTITVNFTAVKTDGSVWDLSEFAFARTLVSGPTFNYQRVIAEQTDVSTRAVQLADTSYSYTFATPIPATYLAPLNDTASFGAADGELTGQALLDGTYTVGLYLSWGFTVDGAASRDSGNAVFDFVVGNSGAVVSRAVVGQDNCNQCHADLRAHGGLRKNVTLCLMCHTAGAEDRNNIAVLNGTPGVSIDFKAMIHKIHAGKHLPSVLGVAVKPDGSREYAATPVPYELVGYQDSILDFSEIGFPVMPSAYVAFTYDATGVNYTGAFGNGPMPRDIGYTALTLNQKRLEDEIRTGPVSCEKCHGDPDGAGPIVAPAQGALHQTAPSRQACSSCHDDIVWGSPYTSNGQTMPAQADNSNCTLCHQATGNVLSVENAHRHPYLDTTFNSGVNIDLTAVGGGSGPNGSHQIGDAIQGTFSVKNNAGTDLQINALTRFQMIVTGPTSNQQWLMPNVNPFDFAWRKSTPFTGTGSASTPVVANGAVAQTIAIVFTSATTYDIVGSVSAALAGQAIGGASGNTAAVSYNGVTATLTQGATAFVAGDRFYFEAVPLAASYTMEVPRDVSFERIGAATGGADVMAFGNTPAYWGRQVVFERTALVGASTLINENAPALGRYIACDSAALALAVGDRVVLDAGLASEEYAQVGRVQTTSDTTGASLGTADKVWMTTGLRFAHSTSGTIQECTLTSKREGIAYTMATSNALSITLVAGQFTLGNPVVVNYRSHGRFGYFDAAGLAQNAIYPPAAAADTDDIDATWGDWKGLALVDGTYSVGMWANRDFTVTPLRVPTAVEAFSLIASDNTTYRMMAPPAIKDFLFGAATVLEPRNVISSGDNCNRCHTEIAAHGFGRRGLETCTLCHGTPGAEDGPKYTYATWYVGATPGVTMDFRSLLHKAHMGKELANASTYTVNGVFLGTPYPVHYNEGGFPALPGGVSNCAICHGSQNDTWQAPVQRDHPSGQIAPTREWRTVCAACHDSSDAVAHIDVQTAGNGQESCTVCHGSGGEWSVERVHKTY